MLCLRWSEAGPQLLTRSKPAIAQVWIADKGNDRQQTGPRRAQTVARGHGTGVRWQSRGGCWSTHTADADSVKGHLSGARLRHDGNVNSAEDRGLAPALSGQVRP